ncbi:hypothetical protein OAS39_04010 [Pirellulales bacterium]|nr:hypothetical protein [Pirellulales bacterium]
MIETPAALYALDEIFDLADFVALGANDLTQTMLANLCPRVAEVVPYPAPVARDDPMLHKLGQ